MIDCFKSITCVEKYFVFQIAHSDKEDPNFFIVKDEAAKKLLIIEDRTSQFLLAGLEKSSVRAEGKD